MSPICFNIEDLRRRVAYDAETGKFTWVSVGSGHRKVGDEAGCVCSRGYVRIGFRHCGRQIRLQGHRVAWALHYGEWPRAGLDHVNGDRTDNRIMNLREATHVENMRNKDVQKNSGTGIKGVFRHSKGAGFEARIVVDGRTNYLGLFPTRELAAVAYARAAQEHFGSFARFWWDECLVEIFRRQDEASAHS